MPENLSVTLTLVEKANLQSLIDAHNYPEAYRYVRDITQATPGADTRIVNWLDKAANINANNGTFESIFVRAATIDGGDGNDSVIYLCR